MKDSIYLAADHAGYERKEQVKTYLKKSGYEVTDFGAEQYDKKDDYPDYAHPMAQAVARDKARGILFCGNAEGVCIVANKVDGIRAALGYSIEATKTSREDDDSNILCLPGREFTEKQILKMIEVWLSTPFSEKERHKRRIQKIKRIEEDN